MAYRDTTIATSNKRDIYAEVTSKIIAQLEAGIAPWVCPWQKSGAGSISLPANLSTKKPYSGINVLLLWLAAQENGFSTNEWLTFKQAQALGATVRKGSKGTHVVYADRFIPKGEAAKAAERGEEASPVFFLKSYCVFNRDQIDGLEPLDAPEFAGKREPHELGERLIAASGADFRIGGDRAYYVPSQDYIQVPRQEQFGDAINYYRTACHELSHWTGHESRLGRKLLNEFGSKSYAEEELVAELSAAFACASLGIEPTVNHSDYIGAWLQVMREDNRAVFKAASLASKAAEFLLGKMA